MSAFGRKRIGITWEPGNCQTQVRQHSILPKIFQIRAVLVLETEIEDTSSAAVKARPQSNGVQFVRCEIGRAHV